jgi:hypothetical protein
LKLPALRIVILQPVLPVPCVLPVVTGGAERKKTTRGVSRTTQNLNDSLWLALELSQNAVQPPEHPLWHLSKPPAVFSGTNRLEFRHIRSVGAGFPTMPNIPAAKTKTPADPAGV